VFQASAAACTFTRADSSVNGGTGGRSVMPESFRAMAVGTTGAFGSHPAGPA
jgi:hypothetical protein